jgi:hypothetical protein
MVAMGNRPHPYALGRPAHTPGGRDTPSSAAALSATRWPHSEPLGQPPDHLGPPHHDIPHWVGRDQDATLNHRPRPTEHPTAHTIMAEVTVAQTTFGTSPGPQSSTCADERPAHPSPVYASSNIPHSANSPLGVSNRRHAAKYQVREMTGADSVGDKWKRPNVSPPKGDQ